MRVASRKAAEGCSSCLGGHESGGRFGRLAARSASSLAVGTPCGCSLKCEGHRDTNRTAVSSLPTRVVRASLVKALRKKGSDDLAPKRSLPHSPCWGGRSRVASFCSATLHQTVAEKISAESGAVHRRREQTRSLSAKPRLATRKRLVRQKSPRPADPSRPDRWSARAWRRRRGKVRRGQARSGASWFQIRRQAISIRSTSSERANWLPRSDST